MFPRSHWLSDHPEMGGQGIHFPVGKTVVFHSLSEGRLGRRWTFVSAVGQVKK